MATVPFTISQCPVTGARVIKWVLGAADSGTYFVGRMADRNVQMFGTWDGATVVLQGTNENPDGPPANPMTLIDVQGNNISLTSNGKAQLADNMMGVRPVSSGGGGTAAITVLLFCVDN